MPNYVNQGSHICLVDVGVGEQLGGVRLVLDEDAALQQALLLGRHYEVMRLVLQDDGEITNIISCQLLIVMLTHV